MAKKLCGRSMLTHRSVIDKRSPELLSNNNSQSSTIYTAGEDGHVTAFRAEQEPQVLSAVPKQAKKGAKNVNATRYRPY
jgi:hypothetical protein